MLYGSIYYLIHIGVIYYLNVVSIYNIVNVVSIYYTSMSYLYIYYIRCNLNFGRKSPITIIFL